MADGWPASLKSIKPYIQRAKELEDANPLVSYYCNLYALKGGMRERDPSDENAAKFIKSLLTKCESLRSTFASTAGTHRESVENFAVSVFDFADEIYQSGRADASTARHFYAAMCFLDVCGHFGELAEDLAALRKRARVYAALIARDVREGRQPLPPQVAKKEEEAEAREDRELANELHKSLTASGTGPSSHDGLLGAGAPEAYSGPASSADARPGPSLDARPVLGTTASTMYAGRQAQFIESTDSVAPAPSTIHPARAVLGGTTASTMHAGDNLKFSGGSRMSEEHFVAHPPVDALGQEGQPSLQRKPSVPPATIAAWLDQTSGPADDTPSSTQRMVHFIPPPPSPTVREVPTAIPRIPEAIPQQPPVRLEVPPTVAVDNSSTAPAVIVQPVKPIAGFKPNLKTISEAQKKAKWAVSALDWQDVDTAVLNLNLSLALLTTGKAPDNLPTGGKAPP